ncbi:MAG: hypothetical protein EOM55_00425 [Clostridia bacterium]|nr:hypothetical protein [Clostridia bacterium]
MKIELENDEILEDLQRDNLKIVQDNSLYKFSSDSVMLSDFACVKKSDFVVELCSGSGVISVLVYAKYAPKKIKGFEVDKHLFNLSLKTLRFNEINAIEFVNDDLKNAPKILGFEKADVVICNPPYFVFPKDTSKISKKNLTTKYESLATLEDIIKASSQLLKVKGKLYFIYTSKRIQELLVCAEKNNLICKELKFIFKENTSDLVLCKFVKRGLLGCEVKKTYIT